MSTIKEMVQSGMWPGTARAVNGAVATGLTGLGSTQATALALTASISNVTTAAASTGVIVPAGQEAGDVLTVRNGGANALLVYPLLGGVINALSANAGFSVAAGKIAVLTALDGINLIAQVSA